MEVRFWFTAEQVSWYTVLMNITAREGEEVLMHLHKSIFTLGRQMLAFAVAVIGSVLLLTFLYKYPAANVIAAVLLIAALLYALYYFIIWFYDVYTITNIRILAFGKKNLFHSEFAEVNYTDIASVSFQISGILATIFQYGNVTLSLGGGEKMELVNLSTPAVVQETIKNLVDVTNNKKYH